MNSLLHPIKNSPVLARVAPFAFFLVLTFAQDFFGAGGRYWLYLAKTILGAWMIWAVRPVVAEMRWKLSWAAVLVGVAVFVLWVGLDGHYPPLNELLQQIGLGGKKSDLVAAAWNPHTQYGTGSALAWLFIGTRLVGSALIVPPLEEVFFRSFVYRSIARADFLSVPLGAFLWMPFLVTALLFGFEHHQWLAGILCGFAYQGLVIWKQRLGDAITAHAITNFLLGVWVVWKGAWQFW